MKSFLVTAIAITLLTGGSAGFAAASDTGQSDTQSDSQSKSSQARISLNFKDADIREVAQSIGAIVDKNFVLDPQVQGRVTLISSKPIPADAVYSTFLSVLQVHGFAAVPAGSVTKIIPALKARQVPGIRSSRLNRAPGDAMVTQVVTIQNVPAAQLVPVLRPLMSTQANLTAYQPSNILVISDRVDNVQRIMRIIRRIDQSGTNAVDIIPLQYATATDIVRVLTGLLKGTRSAKGNPVKLAADQRTNSVLIGGGKSQRLRVKALIAQLDTPQKQGGNTQVIYLHYAKAEDLAKVVQGFISSSEKLKQQQSGKQSGGNTGGASVIPDKGTNSVVVTAPPKLMRSIKQVIDQLDIRRAEVFVQAIIAELSSDRSAELGITWAADAVQNHGTAGVTNFSGTGAGIAQIAGAAARVNRIGGTNFSGVGGIGGAGGNIASSIPDGLTLAVGKIVKGGFSFAALLRALTGNSQTNILSAPSLVTLDNKKAKITVGKQVPFLTGSFTGSQGGNGGIGGGFSNPFQTINRQQVGITLEITPQINQGDSVNLKIHQTVSSIAGSSRGAVDLVTNNREIETNVIAKDGQIIVLGGLMQNNLRESEQKVPLLGDIPLIGNLFKYRATSNTKQNLLVFIRPTILRTPESVSYHTNAKYEYLRNLQLNHKGSASLMPGAERPILPPFNAIKTRPDNHASADGDMEQREPSAKSSDDSAGGEEPPGD